MQQCGQILSFLDWGRHALFSHGVLRRQFKERIRQNKDVRKAVFLKWDKRDFKASFTRTVMPAFSWDGPFGHKAWQSPLQIKNFKDFRFGSVPRKQDAKKVWSRWRRCKVSRSRDFKLQLNYRFNQSRHLFLGNHNLRSSFFGDFIK